MNSLWIEGKATWTIEASMMSRK